MKGTCYLCNAEVTYDEYDPGHNMAEDPDTGDKYVLCDSCGIACENAEADYTPERLEYEAALKEDPI